MIGKLTLSAGLLALSMMAGTQTAAAASAPQTMLGTLQAGEPMVQKTQYWSYCRRWRHECADRWGWRTPRYFRCMGRHGC